MQLHLVHFGFFSLICGSNDYILKSGLLTVEADGITFSLMASLMIMMEFREFMVAAPITLPFLK